MTTKTRRPLRKRIWFYKPSWMWDWRWIKSWAWKLWYRGGDEFDWHTLVIGSPLTGHVVFATHPCDYTGDCAETAEDLYDGPNARYTRPVWPVDVYGINHESGTVDQAWGWKDAHDEFCPAGLKCTEHQNPYN